MFPGVREREVAWILNIKTVVNWFHFTIIHSFQLFFLPAQKVVFWSISLDQIMQQ